MKTLTIPNYNNKLACDVFVHIAPAPKVAVTQSDLPKRFKINSDKQEFEAELVELIKFKFGRIPSILIYASHGMDADNFYHSSTNINMQDDYAVYVYKKA